MKKKVLSGISLAAAAMMLVTACGANGSTGNTGTADTGSATKTEAGGSDTSADNGEKQVLKIMLQQADEVDYENSPMTLYLEEKFNVDLQFDVFSSATDANTQFNLTVTGGEYPDIFLSNWFTPTQVATAIESNVFIPLNDYIEKGSYYKTALEENPDWVNMVTANDGNIYTFFYNDTGVHKASEYKMWYRKDWLENLGWSKAPSTPEEFKQYLIDIRDKDANGNGDTTDEIPLMGYYDGRKTDPICFLMNPYELYTDNYYYITDDNKIHFSPNTDGWRDGLRYIADLYSEGLIAEETYVQDQATFKSILNKDGAEAEIGMFPCWYSGAEIDTNVMSWFTYEPLAPLKGKYQQSAARFGGNFNLDGAISTQCKNPDLAFEILDWLLSEEGTMFGSWGIEGTTYEIVDQESYNGDPKAVKQIVDKLIPDYLWNSGQFPRYDRTEIRYAAVKDESVRETDNTEILTYSASVYEPYYVNHHIPDIVWCSDLDVVQSVTDTASLLKDYIRTADTEFIMGKRDINDDKAWQEYMDGLNSIGLEQYINNLYVYYGLK